MSNEKVVEIEYLYDPDTDMESLSVNGVCVGFGNTHDNHCEDRLNCLIRTLAALGIEHKVTNDNNWKYE